MSSRCTNNLKGGCKDQRDRLFSAVPSESIRGNGHKLELNRFCVNIRCFYFEGDETLAQLTQEGCEVSIPEDIKKLPRHNRVQVALCPCLSKGVGPGGLQRFLPTLAIL